MFSEVRHGGDAKLWTGRSPLGWVLFGPDHERPHQRCTESPFLDSCSSTMLLTGSVAPGLPPDVFMDADSMRSSRRWCQFQIEAF